MQHAVVRAGSFRMERDGVVRRRLGRCRELLGRELAPERGDLDVLGAEPHMREAEPASDDPAVPKEALDLVRMRRGADVEVFRPPVEQQIADAPTDQVGQVIVLVEAVEHFQRIRVDLRARDRVLRARHDHRLSHWLAL
jgi:hypothetical protein